MTEGASVTGKSLLGFPLGSTSPVLECVMETGGRIGSEVRERTEEARRSFLASVDERDEKRGRSEEALGDMHRLYRDARVALELSPYSRLTDELARNVAYLGCSEAGVEVADEEAARDACAAYLEARAVREAAAEDRDGSSTEAHWLYSELRHTRREAVLDALRGYRDMGGARPRWIKGSSKRVRGAVEDVCSYFPTSWIEAGRRIPLYGSPAQRSRYRPSPMPVAPGLEHPEGAVRYPGEELPGISIEPDRNKEALFASAVHELCHHAEDALGWLSAEEHFVWGDAGGPLKGIEEEFLTLRSQRAADAKKDLPASGSPHSEEKHGESHLLRVRSEYSRYRATSVEVPEAGFTLPYTGRRYPDGAREVLAVGYQFLLGGEMRAEAIEVERTEDEEHEDFCLGCLALL